MGRADTELAGRERANSLPAGTSPDMTPLTDQQVQAGINRTRTRLRHAQTDQGVFSAARANQLYVNEASRRAQQGGAR